MDKKLREEFILRNTERTKKLIAESVNEDNLIIQAMSSIEDLDKICNSMSKRVREWYGYYLPEVKIEDHELFIRRIVESDKKELVKEFDIKDSMGGKFSDEDVDAMMTLARQAADLYAERDKLVSYLESVMKRYCPNIISLVGAIITGKLFIKAGSLRHLAFMPSSTIQLLGAETALFRHLRNKGIRPPKHGLILSHPFVMDAKKSDRGKMARMLAAKISIAAKVDYFKGEFIADKLKEDLEKK